MITIAEKLNNFLDNENDPIEIDEDIFTDLAWDCLKSAIEISNQEWKELIEIKKEEIFNGLDESCIELIEDLELLKRQCVDKLPKSEEIAEKVGGKN